MLRGRLVNTIKHSNSQLSSCFGTSIPVILAAKVENLNKEVGDIVEVKRGYARNFLIPR